MFSSFSLGFPSGSQRILKGLTLFPIMFPIAPQIKGISRSEWAHTHDSALTSSCRPFLILVMPLTLSYIGIITWGLITLTLKPWNLKLLNPKTLNPKNLKPFKNLHN
jgi:hypothetical protein